MLMKILRPLPYAADGINARVVPTGEIVDIPVALVPGLQAEGWIGPVPPQPPPPEPPPPEPADSDAAEGGDGDPGDRDIGKGKKKRRG